MDMRKEFVKARNAEGIKRNMVVPETRCKAVFGGQMQEFVKRGYLTPYRSGGYVTAL